MRCPHCGATLGQGDLRICPACGEDINDAQPVLERCPECGAKLPGQGQPCPICGARTPTRRFALPSALFSALAAILTAAGLLGSLWVLQPWAQPATPTPTSAPTATPTRILTKTLTATPTASITPSPTPAFFHHTVIEGDTITFVAEQYGVTVEDLLASNDIGDGEYLEVGQLLTIPLAPDLAPIVPTATEGGPTPTPRPPFHIVADGENLSIIANLYAITVDAIVKANDIANPELISIGQELAIPGLEVTPTMTRPPIGAVPTPTPAPSWRYHTPVLLGPVDGETFRGQDASILLNWASAGVLEADEWYVLRIRLEGAEPVQEEPSSRSEWIKQPSWRVPDWMYPMTEDEPHIFKWDITVVRRPSEGVPEAVSPRSPSRRFSWY